jgi:hypothetical protein
MSKEKKIRELERELNKAREIERNSRKTTQSRNLDYVGPDPNTSQKDILGSADIPDVVLLPRKKRKKSENKW